jgi:hypothetical protein
MEAVGFEHTIELPVEFEWHASHDYPSMHVSAPAPPVQRPSANYSSVSAICVICGTTTPGMEPEGWATWERRIDATFPLPYYLHTCPEHSTHEGLWSAPPVQRVTREWLDALSAKMMDLHFCHESSQTREYVGSFSRWFITAILESLTQEGEV